MSTGLPEKTGYVTASNPSDDNILEISGYTLVRSDHPSSKKIGGVRI